MPQIKKITKFLWDEFIYGGHLISLGAASIVFTSFILLEKGIIWDYLFIVYFSTYIFLLYNRYKEHKTDFLTNSKRTEHIKKYFNNKYLLALSSVFLSVGILLYFYDKLLILIFYFLFLGTGLLYTLLLKKITQKVIIFKNICFSLIASLPIIFLPLYYSYSPLNFAFLLILIFVFLRMLVNTIFLDIKDIKSDKKEKLLTLPIILGEEKTLIFLKAITILSVTPIILGVYSALLPKFSILLLLIIPYTFYYLKKSKVKKNFYLVNYLLADCEFLLWPICILFGKFFL